MKFVLAVFLIAFADLAGLIYYIPPMSAKLFFVFIFLLLFVAMFMLIDFKNKRLRN